MDIQNGTLIRLGRHTLLCGDSTNPHDVARLLGDNRMHLVLTDPPYGIGYVESKEGFTQSIAKAKVIENDHLQTEDEYLEFTKGWISHIPPYLAQKNSIYIFNTDKMLFPLRAGMESAGMKFAQMLIWAKTHAVMARMDYLPQHELIAYGWYGKHEFVGAKDKSILVHPKPSKSPHHPTMKPIGLLRRLILNSSHIGDSVFDPFGGSGSTLLACEQTGRVCYIIEKDIEYCHTIAMLYQKMTGNTPEIIAPAYGTAETTTSV